MSLFQRSRTLQSPKYAKKRQKKLVGAVFLFCISVAVIIAASIYLLKASFLQIDTIFIDNTDISPVISKEIKENALDILSGNYFNLIPKSNILFFPKNLMVKTIHDSFREIDTIAIRRTGLSDITISIKDRIPVALVCAGFREENSNNETCFLADRHANVFAPFDAVSTSTGISASTYNRYYVPADKISLSTSTGFIDERIFSELQTFVDGATRGGLAPQGVLIGEGGEYEMYTKSGTTVYFDNRIPLATSLSNLMTFWQNSLEKNKKSTSTAVFDSVNLHFGKAIYYSHQ